MSNVSAHVAAVLADHVTEVFGVMGNGNAYFLDALTGTRAEFTAVRHEAGGVAAADAYYRACGRLAAATTTYGPGFSNALTPLAEAVQARIPLVLITGAAPTTGPRPWDVDQSAPRRGGRGPDLHPRRHDGRGRHPAGDRVRDRRTDRGRDRDPVRSGDGRGRRDPFPAGDPGVGAGRSAVRGRGPGRRPDPDLAPAGHPGRARGLAGPGRAGPDRPGQPDQGAGRHHGPGPIAVRPGR